MQTGVDYFLPRKYDVISQLRHSYAKDPLCVARLICKRCEISIKCQNLGHFLGLTIWLCKKSYTGIVTYKNILHGKCLSPAIIHCT